MNKRCLPLLAWLAALGLPSGALAQPVGPQFQVNTYTTGPQLDPAIASDASGNFVVVWDAGRAQDGSRDGVFGRRFDSDGNPLGGEFQVNTYTTSHQDHQDVASDASGNFVVVWESNYQDGNFTGIFGQRYDSDGNPLGGEFRVNSNTLSFEENPSIASDASGNFVVVWESNVGISGQRYDRNGQTLGGEFQAAPHRLGDVASDAIGDFVVVSEGEDYRFSKGLFGQRFDRYGNPAGGEFQVNTYTTHDQLYPSVASDPSGNFVVVWLSYGQDGDSLGIFGQRYDRNGTPLGGEFQVNTYTTGPQAGASVTSDPSGNFVVVWGSGASSEEIFGQRYDSDGNPLGREFQVNTYTTGPQFGASVTSDASGNVIVVWTDGSLFGDGQDGDSLGIFGQRFSGACEASLQVQGDVHTPGSNVAIQVHIAHRRPKTVTVPWELRLIDASGQRIARRATEPHTFEPGDVVDREVEFQLPNDLAAGTYTLELAISGMAGTKGAMTSLQVIRAE